MDKYWNDFNKIKPVFKHQIDGTWYSNQLLLFIDNHLFIGYYEKIPSADRDGTWFYVLEFGSFGDKNLIEELGERSDGDCYFEQDSIHDPINHDIYWHSVNTLDIICNIDLQKMQREDGKDDSIKA